MADEDRKIIVDEDWKGKVQREKEEALAKSQEPQEGQPAAGEEAGAVEDGGQPEDQAQPDLGDVDQNFMALMSSLVTQAMYALGMVPQEEGSNQVMVDLNASKQLVDILVMLKKKTEGNLTNDESRQLTEAISELQRVYVLRSQQVQEQTMKQAGMDPSNITQMDPNRFKQ